MFEIAEAVERGHVEVSFDVISRFLRLQSSTLIIFHLCVSYWAKSSVSEVKKILLTFSQASHTQHPLIVLVIHTTIDRNLPSLPQIDTLKHKHQ